MRACAQPVCRLLAGGRCPGAAQARADAREPAASAPLLHFFLPSRWEATSTYWQRPTQPCCAPPRQLKKPCTRSCSRGGRPRRLPLPLPPGRWEPRRGRRQRAAAAPRAPRRCRRTSSQARGPRPRSPASSSSRRRRAGRRRRMRGAASTRRCRGWSSGAGSRRRSSQVGCGAGLHALPCNAPLSQPELTSAA